MSPNASIRYGFPLLSLLASAFAPVHAAELKIDDPEIEACVVKSAPDKAMSQHLTLRLFKGADLINTTGAELFWKRGEDGYSRALIRVTEPRDRAGLAVLALERGEGDPDLHVYMPEARKARRVSGNTIDASMFGTDFSYEDFAHFQGLATDSNMKRLADQDLQGHATYVVETLPGSKGSKYSRILSYIDKEQCTLARMEFFAKNGSVLKELVVPREAVREVGTRWIPHHVILNDLKRESRTELVVEKIEIDPELSDNLFSVTKFGAGQ
jgi:Outer membrane lipoprotein-sorting protein